MIELYCDHDWIILRPWYDCLTCTDPAQFPHRWSPACWNRSRCRPAQRTRTCPGGNINFWSGLVNFHYWVWLINFHQIDFNMKCLVLSCIIALCLHVWFEEGETSRLWKRLYFQCWLSLMRRVHTAHSWSPSHLNIKKIINSPTCKGLEVLGELLQSGGGPSHCRQHPGFLQILRRSAPPERQRVININISLQTTLHIRF